MLSIHSKFENNKTFLLDYCKETVFPMIVKLMNAFLILKDSDLWKISTLIPNLEKVQAYLIDNCEIFKKIFNVQNDELCNKENHQMNNELIKINGKIKAEKIVINSNSLFIKNFCEILIGNDKENISSEKRSFIKNKNLEKRVENVVKNSAKYSHKLEEREEVKMNCLEIMKKK